MQLFQKKLDKNTPIPLYFQLKGIILSDIQDNSFSVGDAIPTENELVEYYHISRSTVRQAISELVQEGWLTRKASKGTFLTKPEQNPVISALSSLFTNKFQGWGKLPVPN